VKGVQGDTTLKSKILVVFYDSAGSVSPVASAASTAPPAAAEALNESAMPGGGGSSIRRLRAWGRVIVTRKDQV
jgi:lipopolysaccharide export system protein LptA